MTGGHVRFYPCGAGSSNATSAEGKNRHGASFCLGKSLATTLEFSARFTPLPHGEFLVEHMHIREELDQHLFEPLQVSLLHPARSDLLVMRGDRDDPLCHHTAFFGQVYAQGSTVFARPPANDEFLALQRPQKARKGGNVDAGARRNVAEATVTLLP